MTRTKEEALNLIVRTKSFYKLFQKQSKRNQALIVRAVMNGRNILTPSTAVHIGRFGGLHYTTDHTGKMKGLFSISSSVIANPICQARRQDKESICAHCFAAAQMDRYPNTQNTFYSNSMVLRHTTLLEADIPVILTSSGFFRGESFGDSSNVLHAANLLNICALNPWLKCAIWTKNPGHYHTAIQTGRGTKGKNTNLVFSSSYVNQEGTPDDEYLYMFSRVFTVYDNPGINEQNVVINCGARSCASCGLCYKQIKSLKPGEQIKVNEKLK